MTTEIDLAKAIHASRHAHGAVDDLSGYYVTGLASAAVMTTAVSPVARQKNRYSAASGSFAPVLPALSGLSAGPAEYYVEKDGSDTTANTVTITCAGSDTFENGTSTTKILAVPSEWATLVVVSIAGTKFWALKGQGTGRAQTDLRYSQPMSFQTPASGIIATLRRGIRSCALAIGGGDSTADDSLNEWFGLLGKKLQAKYPAYTLRYRQWSDTAQDFALPVDVTAGTGNGGGERYVNSIGGNVFFQPLTVPGITGDVDIRVKLLPTSWNPGVSASEWLAAKYDAAATDGRCVHFGLISGKVLQFKWSSDGTAGNAVSKTSTAAVPFADGTAGWVRVVHDVDNGAAGNDVKFYTSTDGATWTQLGTTVTTAGTTTHGGAPTIPWRYNDNTQGTAAATTRQTYWVEVRNGIAGPLITPPLLEDWDTIASVTMGGAPVLLFQNGSFAGQNTTYFDDVTRRVLLNQPCNQRLVFLNTNTNEASNTRAAFQATYLSWVGHVRSLVPNAPIVPVTQMRVYIGSMITSQVGIDQREARADQIMTLANTGNNVYPVDTMAVWPTGSTQTLLTKTDGLHPSSFVDTIAGGGTYPNGTYTGSQLIADTLYAQLFGNS